MPDTSRKWDGGYVRTDSKGRDTFVIYRRIGGRLYDVSTRCHSSAAAHKQLTRFEADPANYDPADAASVEGLAVDPKLVKTFLEWSRAEKGNTAKWVRDQQRALAWWLRKLPRKDFRRLTTGELVALLDDAQGRKQKIATLKTFCSWLIEERHVLAPTENPTAGLRVPQARPEQWTQVKAIDRETFEAVRAELSGTWADAADVLAGTGWHFTELQRFAESGRVEAHPQTGDAVLACPQTKSGEPLRTIVSKEVAAAGRRLLGKPLDYFHFREALITASAVAEVDPVQPGHFRHSVATWAINAGAAPAAVAAFLNHKSVQTTKRFYATHAVPAKVPTLK